MHAKITIAIARLMTGCTHPKPVALTPLPSAYGICIRSDGKVIDRWGDEMVWGIEPKIAVPGDVKECGK